MVDPRVILFAGGGTGGHVYPGLALAEELTRLAPDVSIHWVGTEDRVEARAVPRAGYPIEFMDVAYLKGRRGLALLGALARLPRAGLGAMGIVRRLQPAAVIGLGGFVSGPVCAAAAMMGYPVFLLEQNARPGVTNRAVSKVAKTIYATFEASREHFPTDKVKVLGNPVRPELFEDVARAERGDDEAMHLLVFGGSQGARSLNEHMAGIVKAIRDAGIDVIVRHASGRDRLEEIETSYAAAEQEAELTEYIDDMGSAYAWADLVVCRAGATTIAELTAIGLPALYVPFPFAADDHQTANATSVVEAGGAVMVRDDEMEGGRPVRLLVPLLQHPEVLERMGAAARRLGRPDAGAAIATDILDSIQP